MPLRIIMLVDLDYFFAQCEELRNPILRDKPVVIGVYSGRSPDSGAVSTANYIAREHGVKSGMPIYLAKKKLENVEPVFLPVDHEFYEKISGEAMATLRLYADTFEQAGIDEAFLDVTKRVDGRFESATSLAMEIKKALVSHQRLTCSIGIGPNKLVAKIAADDRKPDGLTVVEPDKVTIFLERLPANRLIGVGAKTMKKMEALGLNTIGDLAKCNIQKLVAVFGKAMGTYFHEASLGIDNEPLNATGEPESLSRIVTLKEDTHDLNKLLERVQPLCVDIGESVASAAKEFRTVSIIAITTDLKIHTRSKTFESPTCNIQLIKDTAKELFEKFLNETELCVRRVGIKASNLVNLEKGQKQMTSFFTWSQSE